MPNVMINRRFLGVAIGLAVVLAACSSSATSPAPSPTDSAPATAASPADGTPTGAIGSPMAQTDTDWGRIWDGLPGDFPTVPGATPGDATGTGAASADLVVEGGDPQAIENLLETQLNGLGYATVGSSGPLEDGSYVLDMTGSGVGCMVQVTASPMGSLIAIRIMYGAACPFE